MAIDLSDQFTTASTKSKALQQVALDETAGVRMGNLDVSQVTTTIALNLAQNAALNTCTQQEKNNEAMLYVTLLQDMQDRLNDLNASLAKREQALKDKYGEDYINAMAQSYLSEEEQKGLTSNQERLKALAGKFLNPDGTIKDKYKHLEEAKYVQEWQEAEQLRSVINKYENKQTLTPEDRQELTETAQSLGLAGQDNFALQVDNQSVEATVASLVDEVESNNKQQTNSVAFNFGATV